MIMKKIIVSIMSCILAISLFIMPVQAMQTSGNVEISYVSTGTGIIDAGGTGSQIQTGDSTRYGLYLLAFLGASIVMAIAVLAKKKTEEFKTTDL